ncbi:IclR family transcriptional regulator [Frigidibacter sp. ROC022]|uniref:IclR family transcriptional regulator n=1 Tax=Frigidibacter sp. ROC022 TaxID=2971796 RepID=UPI00215B1568|nr:IclR family transcriptional regulator [Frigidibacter sp. ROC022]MCR8724667.1 IclR family transcriptional regulator [Frigidibacter sp. ROC022]
MPPTPSTQRSVKSAERALDLLETIGKSPSGLTFTMLSEKLNIPKSSLHALLDVLRSRDYIELDPNSRLYTLGVRVWETGFAYHRHHNAAQLAVEAMTAIVDKVNETTQYAKLVGSENVYLAKVESTHPLRLQSEVGVRLPAHATGIGKALLAQLDDEEVRSRLPNEQLQRFTDNTIVTVTSLLEELHAIRQRGFAIDNEEYSQGIFCVAVPVPEPTGRPATALSVSVPVSRATREGLVTILGELASGSLSLAGRLGGKYSDPQLESLRDSAWADGCISQITKSGSYKLSFLD